jgi:cytochrome c peroxidase
MKKNRIFYLLSLFMIGIGFSFTTNENKGTYIENYVFKLSELEKSELSLIDAINQTPNINSDSIKNRIKKEIQNCRFKFKGLDFWMRYIEPLSQKKINGPLPVEWETEVFEKYEKPYKREGAGFTLALQYLDEDQIDKSHLLNLINQSLAATKVYQSDSIKNQLISYHHFYLCNRLYLLNLATIYTTGFDCPEKESILPELKVLLKEVSEIYSTFNQTFPNKALSQEYLDLYKKTKDFVEAQPLDYSNFNHYIFIRDYINPLFAINQKLINQYKVVSKSFVDYTLNKKANSIFSKDLYFGQDSKGIFLRVNDENTLAQIDKLGKLLFYDPILSGNNQRSCVSCHNPSQFFTDTTSKTSLQYNYSGHLERNSPSLVNAPFNHLLMVDGEHFTLQMQGKAVITNPKEMGAIESEVLQKVLSCPDYKQAFTELLKFTPTESEITFDHLVSAITFYYSKFSKNNSLFDDAMNKKVEVDEDVMNGFNVFMSKAECATCHFAPIFNGVKPPYVGSEFEVLGTPHDIDYKKLSSDKGRFQINPALETLHAFRTGTIRNATKTKPYMHNGVFNTLEEVIEFYNGGGGAGRGLVLENQTLSSDSLNLSNQESADLIAFIGSLTEQIPLEKAPENLPKSSIKALNKRKIGGEY